MKANNQGFIFAFVAAIIFGASTPAAKLLLNANDPWLTAGLLYFGSGVGIFTLNTLFRFFGKRISSALRKGRQLLRVRVPPAKETRTML